MNPDRSDHDVTLWQAYSGVSGDTPKGDMDELEELARQKFGDERVGEMIASPYDPASIRMLFTLIAEFLTG